MDKVMMAAQLRRERVPYGEIARRLGLRTAQEARELVERARTGRG